MNPRMIIRAVAWSTFLAWIPTAGLAAQAASAVSRPGAGNWNNAHYCVAPRIGHVWSPSVVNYLSTAAVVIGTTGMATTPFLNQTLLIDLNSTIIYHSSLLNPASGQTVQYGGLVPNNPQLIGMHFSTQAVIIDSNFGPTLYLTNACDMIVGT